MEQDLSVEIGFLEALRFSMPSDREVLRILAEDYTQAGRLQEGLVADLELAELCPRDALVHYNLACSYSLLGHLKESARALIHAIRMGYREWDWMQKDSDLTNLRKSREFALVSALIAKQSS